MSYYTQQLNYVNGGQELPMKQVRFANGNSVPAVLSNTDPNDATIHQVTHDGLGPRLKLLPLNDQIRELQTIIRDK